MAYRAYKSEFKLDSTCSRLGSELFMHLEYKYAPEMIFLTIYQRPQGLIKLPRISITMCFV